MKTTFFREWLAQVEAMIFRHTYLTWNIAPSVKVKDMFAIWWRSGSMQEMHEEKQQQDTEKSVLRFWAENQCRQLSKGADIVGIQQQHHTWDTFVTKRPCLISYTILYYVICIAKRFFVAFGHGPHDVGHTGSCSPWSQRNHVGWRTGPGLLEKWSRDY